MMLRIMLLGLVASLGVDAPSRSDVESWAGPGAAWVMAQLDDRSGPSVGPTDCRQALESPASPAPAADPDSDLAFEAAAGTMADAFSADLVAARIEEAAPVAPLDVEPASCLADLEDGPDPAELAPVLADEAIDADDSPDRLASALRLTREAVNAWAALLQADEAGEQPTR